MLWIIDAVLIVALLLFAAGALGVRDPRHACLFFVAFGLALGAIWLRLGAPDLALAEVLVGAGLTGALLLRTLARLRDPHTTVASDDLG